MLCSSGLFFRLKLGLPTVKLWASFRQAPASIRTSKSYVSFSGLPSILKCHRVAHHHHDALQKCRELFKQQPRKSLGQLQLCKRCSGSYSKTEVVRDILLYKNDKGTFFKILGLFASAQLVFWSYLTHTALLTMKDTDTYMKAKYGEEGPPEDIKNWTSWSGIRMSLSSGMWRYGMTALSIGAGSIIFICSFLYSRRSIHRIVLRKGGENVTIQTYGLFSLLWRFTTPLGKVSCEHSRQSIRTQLPIKVKGHRLFYILDNDGKFYNTRLFDFTVGMHRII